MGGNDLTRVRELSDRPCCGSIGTSGREAERSHRSDTSLTVSSVGAVLLALIAFFLLATAPSSSSAAITHKLEAFSPLDGSGSGVTLAEPQAVALDEQTGNVFASNGRFNFELEQPEGWAAILGSEGGAPSGLTSPYEIAGLPFGDNNNEAGVAFDNSPASPARGTLYVSALPQGTAVVQKYARNAATEKYEPAGEIPLGFSERSSTLSVDSRGNLFVSHSEQNGSVGTLTEFAPDGTELHEYSFSTTAAEGNPVVNSGQVAVGSHGEVFAVKKGGGLYEFPADAFGEIDPENYRQVVPGFVTGLAMDPADGHLYLAMDDHVTEFDPTTNQVVAEFGFGALQRTSQIALNAATGRIYVADSIEGRIVVFGPAVLVPTPTTTSAANVAGTKATLSGVVNPEGLPLTGCEFEYGTDTSYGNTIPCEGALPSGSTPQPVSANVKGLTPNGTAYHFRLVARNANGPEQGADKEFRTAPLAETRAATGVNSETATLNGAVRPEGESFTDCRFEYGVASSGALSEATPCVPPATSIAPDFAVDPVTATLAGLSKNTAYRFRVTAERETGGPIHGEELEFVTRGAPQIIEPRAFNADQTSVTLDAKINPRGFPTQYRFEWGPTAAYGNSVPAKGFEPSIGAGEQPVPVTVDLSGLAPGIAYHYRIVARSGEGRETFSPDQIAETLNSCGLPEGRCFELVSPHDVGPVAIPAQVPAASELHFQAGSQPGALAYVVESGFPDATKGAEVLYQATREPSGHWTTSQLSAPILAQTNQNGANAFTSSTYGLSEDLGCGVLASNQPLTSDPGSLLVQQAGGADLYRDDPGANPRYTAITTLVPENLETRTFLQDEYVVAGFSSNCGKVVFTSHYQYPGIPVALEQGEESLYEWDEGKLRSVGQVPDPTGEAPVQAVAGSGFNTTNAVSADGSRVFFSAPRKLSANPEEIGRIGVFVREDGHVTRDVSLSETAVPDEGASYQYASADGSKVFFTANAGLTDASSSEGTDLYEYDLRSEKLKDLSIGHQAGGASVVGFVGGSADGSQVYFLASGQLVPGKGKTFAQNQASSTYSLYAEKAGSTTFVATIGSVGKPSITGNEVARLTMQAQVAGERTTRVSPDGRYLLFETRGDVTGYEAGNYVPEAYLFDAATDITVCVSCRQNGEKSSSYNDLPPIVGGESRTTNPGSPSRALVVRDGRPQVYFVSFDRLAEGATEGLANVYEWSHGQVFTITTEPPGISETPTHNERTEEGVLFSMIKPVARFIGASAEGSDLYIATPGTLNWEDGDERTSVYDARIGGGFPPPPAGAAPCDPSVEGACQGPPNSAPPPTATPPTSTFNGPGNAKTKKQKHKKHKKHKKKGAKKHKDSNGKGKKSKHGKRSAQGKSGSGR